MRGLINRFIFSASYAKQYAPEIVSRKSILKLANEVPLIVDADVQLADLGATLLVENLDALIECHDGTLDIESALQRAPRCACPPPPERTIRRLTALPPRSDFPGRRPRHHRRS